MEGNRTWLVPAYEGKGAVPGNADLGDESKVGLRLLFDRGFQPDSAGGLYPLGSGGDREVQTGASGGAYSLQWAGAAGPLPALAPGLARLPGAGRAARLPERRSAVGDLLTLDPAQADLVDYHLCFWEKVSAERGRQQRPYFAPRLLTRKCYEQHP